MRNLAVHRFSIIWMVIIFFYFLWMDVTLYYKIQNMWITYVPPQTASDHPIITSSKTVTPTITHNHSPPKNSIMTVEVSTSKMHISSSFESLKDDDDETELFTPFKGLSVKLIMMDPSNGYIFTPLAEAFDRITRFSERFTQITPNMISFAGVICAFISARLILHDSLSIHRLAVMIFQMRTFYDALDGIVARYHMGIKIHVSVRSTSGYLVDAVADTIGFTVFVIACYFYLEKNLPKRYTHHQYLPLQDPEATNGMNGSKSSTTRKSPVSHLVHSLASNNVLFVVSCYSLQLAVTSLFWNRYIEVYHQLLETPPSSLIQANRQNEVLHSSITWVIMWFWRVSCGHSLMQMLLVAVFFNKLWDFLTWIQYVGFCGLFILAFFTEIHLYEIESYLNHVT